jgi:alkyl hydroperoxide reductase subunit AhpC
LVDFAVHGGPLKELGIRVAAASVDTLEQTIELRTSLRVGYPMYAELDGLKVAGDIGAYVQTGDRPFLHATNFLLNPEGQIVNALYSSGPIGRITASDVLRKTLFEKQK